MICVHCDLFSCMNRFGLYIQIVNIDRGIDHEVGRSGDDTSVKKSMTCAESLLIKLVKKLWWKCRKQNVYLPFQDVQSGHNKPNSHFYFLHRLFIRLPNIVNKIILTIISWLFALRSTAPICWKSQQKIFNLAATYLIKHWSRNHIRLAFSITHHRYYLECPQLL
jgi:hypothetical protein